MHAVRTSAPAQRPAATRLVWQLLRPLFLGPTGLADGLAPEERRYHRDSPADSPLPNRIRRLANGSPVPLRPTACAGGDSAGCMTAGTIYPPAGEFVQACPRFRPGPLRLRWLHCPSGRRQGGLLVMKTYVATPLTRERNWLVVDAIGQDARPARHPDRRRPARQAQARLHAARGRGRLRDRRERRADRGHRQQAGRRSATTAIPAIRAGCAAARSRRCWRAVPRRSSAWP